MSLLVKICGLSEERHALDAVAAGADALGFVFAESVRRVTPKTASSICKSVPAHVKRVAVMRHPANNDWLDVLQTFKPDVLQTDAEDFDDLEVPGTVECWPVFREGKTKPCATGTYLYEGMKSGQGKPVDWSTAGKLARSGGMILAGGLDADNIERAIRAVRPFGVDVSSGVESSPGQKDSQLIRDFINAAKAAEKNL